MKTTHISVFIFIPHFRHCSVGTAHIDDYPLTPLSLSILSSLCLKHAPQLVVSFYLGMRPKPSLQNALDY